MFKEYQSYKIFIYFTKKQEPFIQWAKIYWLLKTAHPIELIPLTMEDHTDLNFQKWQLNNMPYITARKGLYVPATIRPLIDIDLLLDSDRSNRMGRSQDNSCIFCVHDLEKSDFNTVEISEVFEDFSSLEFHQKIYEEIDILQNKLCLNV